MLKVFLVLIEVSEYDPAPTATALKEALDVGTEGAPEDLALQNISDIHVIELGRT